MWFSFYVVKLSFRLDSYSWFWSKSSLVCKPIFSHVTIKGFSVSMIYFTWHLYLCLLGNGCAKILTRRARSCNIKLLHVRGTLKKKSSRGVWLKNCSLTCNLSWLVFFFIFQRDESTRLAIISLLDPLTILCIFFLSMQLDFCSFSLLYFL